MFKKAEMEPLARKNLRYRILKTEDRYYLLDVERPFLIVYFLPLLIYFVPHRCYEMSKEEYEQLSQSEEKNARLKEAFEKHGLGYGFGAGVSAMFLSRVFDINQFLKFNSAILSKILACIILMFVSVLRLWVTKFYKLPSEFQNKQYQKIYIFPRFFKVFAPVIYTAILKNCYFLFLYMVCPCFLH